MALQWNTVPMPFAQGLDTKSDPKQVQLGRLLELENGVFTQPGAIAKRHGYDVLSASVEGSATPLTKAAGLAAFGDELLLFAGQRLYSRVDATDAWRDRGAAVSLVAETTPVVRNGYRQQAGDMAEARGIQVFVWQDSRGGLRYSVRDAASGAFYVFDAAPATPAGWATGIRPKVLWFEAAGLFVILYGTGANLVYRTIAPGTPLQIGAETGLIGTFVASYDAIVVAGSRLFVAWDRAAAAGVRILHLDGAMVASAESAINPATVRAPNALGLMSDTNRNIWLVAADATTVRAAWISYSFGAQLAWVTLETVSGVQRVAGAVPVATATMLYEVEGATAPDTLVRRNTLTFGGVAGMPADFLRSVGLASKCFVEDAVPYVVVTHDSALQPTYFVATLVGEIVARLSANLGGGLLVNAALPEVVSPRAGAWRFATQMRGKLQVQSGALFSLPGLGFSTIDFADVRVYGTASVGRNLLLVGGVLQGYDGAALTEHGFHLFPEGVTAVVGATGTMAPGAYQYQVLYEWTDAIGQTHRSAPSVALTATIPGGPSTGSVTLTLPTLRLSAKSLVRIAIYRTQANASIFYRVTSLTTPLFNAPTVDTVAFTDTLADSALPGNELLYTTGGVLDHVAPAACALAVTFKNRVMLAGLQDKLQIAFSKSTPTGEPVAFNDALTIPCDPRGGAITALGVLDDKLVVFKSSAIFALAGEGPNNLGQGAEFAAPSLITTDVGCKNPQSVVATPAGLMFQSEKGIYLLDRSLSVSYVGAPVELYNAQRITAATLVPDTNQVRFASAEGRALVYDYQVGQWSTFTNHPALGSAIWRGTTYCYVRADGRVYRENSAKWTDGAEPIKMRAVTGWMSLAGIQGFQRVRSIHVLGEYRSVHKLLVGVATDFSPVFTQTATIDAGTLIGRSTYGSDSPYGAGSPYGGVFTPYQFEARVVDQKSTAIRVSIEDAQASDFGESYRLSALTLTVGVKRGARQLPASRNF